MLRDAVVTGVRQLPFDEITAPPNNSLDFLCDALAVLCIG